jgi:hypothetical protein
MTKEALKIALEALTDFDYDKRIKAIEVIKEALETKEEQRTWVGLTREELAEILCDDRWQGRPELMMLQVQAKLKERNT